MSTARMVISAIDFLELLVSYLLSDGKYTDNAGIWTQAVLTLRERHEQEHHELFEDFKIVVNLPALPYSQEVSQWLTMLSFCVGAPAAPSHHREEGIEYLKFPEIFQQRARKHPLQRLPQEVVTLIQGFAEEVAREGLLDPS